MSNNNFEDLLRDLHDVQDEDNSRLLKALINIRKFVDYPKNKDNITTLQEKGSLKIIVTSLQTSKKNIIDVCLSILGNVCLDSKSARDAVSQFQLLSNLNQLLKRYPKEDSINGRVFRIVGNICQHRDQWANVVIDKKPQILIHIVKFLQEEAETEEDGKTSEATITMAIRSLREMLNGENLKDLIKTYGALKVVGMLLIKYGNIWEESKKYENVLVNIIKLLQHYSRYKFYPSILEMRTTDKGDAMVYLSKILMIAPKQIVKIVMNFLKISQLKSDLPLSEMFDSFIEVVRKNNIIEEFNATCEECVRCICRLLEHPGNRKNERCGESISLLINVLRDLPLDVYNKIDSFVLIVSTLNKCKYNDALILEQIKCNIVGVIDDKLNQLVGGVEPMNVTHKCDKKRKRCMYLECKMDHKRSRLRPVDDCMHDEDVMSSSSWDDEMSPWYPMPIFDLSSASSSESELTMSWTSGLSPQSSPRSQICGIFESDSDDYSPVCSEVDTNDFPLPMMDVDASSNPELDNKTADEILEDDERFETDTGGTKHIKIRILIEVVELLKTYVKLRPPVAQLGNPELLLRLIKCSVYFEWPHSSAIMDIVDVVHRVLESHDYLLPLMQSDFIPAVYNLGKIQHGSWCSKCRQFQWISSSILKKLSKLAESGAGKGDIAHKLLRGDTLTKQQLVLVIPYIVENKAILMKLMLNCGGLEVLIKLLSDEELALQEKSIRTLCLMARKNLGIPNPVYSRNIHKASSDKWEDVEKEEWVTFKLDDGSLLKAERGLLSKVSDFFSRLFNGGFKEAKEDVITLPNVMNESLGYLLDLAKRDIRRMKPMQIKLDLNTHLDVIALCDRFLMPDHCVYLTHCVEKFRLTWDTIPVIYNWAMESRTNLLRVECIAFALVGSMLDMDRYAMFKALFELEYKEELLEDIRKLLVRYITMNQFCDCSQEKNCCDEFHGC